MKRRHFLGMLAAVPMLGALAYDLPSNVTAQQGGDQATIAALQTKVAVLSTEASLQTKAATLETQVASGPVTTPGGGAAEKVLYQTGQSGFKKWVGSGWHALKDSFVSDGSNSNTVLAPFDTGSITDYAVEAEIQINQGEPFQSGGFGLVLRVNSSNGYYVGGGDYSYGGEVFIRTSDPAYNWLNITRQNFKLDHDWHTYRFEANGNQLSLFQDGGLLLSAVDNRGLDGTGMGLQASDVQVTVRNFRVLAL